MCGFTGFWEPGLRDVAELSRRAAVMADSMVHRGPDDGGVWVDAAASLALGFRRLAIVDLSPHGHQPMESESGVHVIAFNGEVYNFAELRGELEPAGHRFRGHSDTEVMLAAIEQWGLEAAVRRFVGMFAFALWDRQKQRLSLVRDRLGVKPLYYAWMGRTLLFGSELKALRAHPNFQPEIDRDVVTSFLRHNYVPGPYTIYRGCRQLTPGHILTLPSCEPDRATAVPYWTAREVAERGLGDPFDGSDCEAIDHLDERLREAVRRRMVADVPLGAFLSGGIDSSTVVGLMQSQSSRPVKTFTIGFNESGFDEATFARAVAEHLHTDHTELYVSPTEAQTVIPRLPEIFDEPFSDSSQIPTYLISNLTRQQVTVSLSGDGGDEVFGGYGRYFKASALWKQIAWVPKGIRLSVGRGLGAARLQRHARGVGRKLHTFSEVLELESAEALYRQRLSHWKSPAEIVIGGSEPPTALTDPERWAAISDFSARMMYLDTISYLPDDILTKLDRAGMAVSLEARVPLLDHRVVEFAWRLPLAMKIRDGQGKWALRQVLNRYVPSEITDRPKRGFSVPIGSWRRAPLGGCPEALLDERRLRDEGFFHPAPIRAKWQEHLSGRWDWHTCLWDVLMFQAWYQCWGKVARVASGASIRKASIASERAGAAASAR
jgi:asparagine synthase (glutamine-hydrolysing)